MISYYPRVHSKYRQTNIKNSKVLKLEKFNRKENEKYHNRVRTIKTKDFSGIIKIISCINTFEQC